jgi:K+-sensing histidine kinase KdpD
LEQIHIEEHESKRGKLKIFFGYAAGVGKTYAMLEAAHEAKKQGIDVVAGYIEPHARPATAALVNGLEVISPLVINHKDITLNEFNLDAAIKRNPQLILVDELAHTNADGCRHIKRYQDIEELLKAGIDVYTTINVQHIESLNDIVASITKIIVRERIPDRIFDEAEQVELVDIEPSDLVTRLSEGKIYQKEQADRALGNFFTVENLTALREIALRRMADRVNKISLKVKNENNKDYYTNEHILVCLSSSPSNSKIIRTAARMANAFKAQFTALFVQTSSFEKTSLENKKRLKENIHLAVAMNTGTQAAKEAGNMVDLDSSPTKLIEVVRIGKQLLMTRGSLTTFSIANDLAKYFAIIPSLFLSLYPGLSALNIMNLHSPQSAVLSAIIYNALIIVALIPLALKGVKYREVPAGELLKRNLLIYGLGGIIEPFICIKIIDVILVGLGLV